jgi:hypothetical protein
MMSQATRINDASDGEPRVTTFQLSGCSIRQSVSRHPSPRHAWAISSFFAQGDLMHETPDCLPGRAPCPVHCDIPSTFSA